MSTGRDPGLQPERTRLAWRRTLLTVTVVTVLAVRLASTGDTTGALIAGGTVLVWGALLVLCWPRGTGTGPARTGGRTLPLATAGTVVLALLGVLLVLRGLW
ncbi:DUF202 domain-containing protein [Micromonospora vinacea]|uniref:Uncharacterized membrane protein YidH (DUF202 family) n=1 Tax=Micromonospora vinacea TaxID=709878 RepID=A0ABS0K273_9ACTN|nr:DUF202 domain-containing protein [Micromonospora vinacea]MBG6102660.1 uncharacterized membrane protein YidH (DUF202 family) [Micromonospora vinacea]WSZ74566.1 DUF202 domain-containing protein [Micromonospora sp. NBC_00860]WTA68958.1 DUF202 domain-containing protein [Micromonospora sp. NBC_00855]